MLCNDALRNVPRYGTPGAKCGAQNAFLMALEPAVRFRFPGFALQVGASSLRGHQVRVPDTPWSAIGGMEEVIVAQASGLASFAEIR